MTKKLDKTNILLNHIVNVIQDAKGKDIISLALGKIESAICQYFIICTGNSSTHVKSIQGKIMKTISKDLGEKPWHCEGGDICEWVLMDYYDIVVHIFQDNTRKFYNLEEFWGDAKFKKHLAEK